MRIEYHPETVSDLNNAVEQYNAEQTGLGNAFQAEINSTIERILQYPRLYADANGMRRALVKRFPYSVLYKLPGNDCVRILVIRHHKRRVDYGAARQ